MAYLVMSYLVMAYVVTCSYRLSSYGLSSYGISSYGLSSYGAGGAAGSPVRGAGMGWPERCQTVTVIRRCLLGSAPTSLVVPRDAAGVPRRLEGGGAREPGGKVAPSKLKPSNGWQAGDEAVSSRYCTGYEAMGHRE